MAQNRYIFLPPNSLDSPTQDGSMPNTAKSTSILNCKRVSDCEELSRDYSQGMMGFVSWIHFVLLHSLPIP